MSVPSSHASVSRNVVSRCEWRFGMSESGGGIEWLLKRNCSITPAHLLAAYGGLCAVSLGVALAWWWQGARLVVPFAGCELLAVGAALLVFARHAGDRERIRLGDGRLLVEWTNGRRVDRVEFAQEAVRVEPGHGEHSLIELSGRGERIAVGRYVRPEWRPALADELRAALRGPSVRGADGLD
jgi:uncharacterized membrane protein